MNKKIIVTFIFVAIGGVAGNLGTQAFLNRNNIEDFKSKIIEENKKLPRQVDELTTMTKMEVIEDTLHYHYVISLAKEEVPDFKEKMALQIDKNICATDSSKALSNVINLAFHYVDKNNQQLDEFSYAKGYCP